MYMYVHRKYSKVVFNQQSQHEIVAFILHLSTQFSYAILLQLIWVSIKSMSLLVCILCITHVSNIFAIFIHFRLIIDVSSEVIIYEIRLMKAYENKNTFFSQ
jgi:hypothetical protein